MNTLSTRVRYRPVRIGWCVRDKNMEDLNTALRLTHTLSGGRFNPIIPMGAMELAEQLIDLFRVDILYPVTATEEGTKFIEKFPYLPWPPHHRQLFIGSSGGIKSSTFLDIYHSVRKLHEENIKGKEKPNISASFYDLEPTDPAENVMLALCGGYPKSEDTGGIDYSGFAEKRLNGKRTGIKATDALPADCFRTLTPSTISSWALTGDRYSHSRGNPGLYIGSASDFDDIMNFWNLRAADIDLVFLDPAQKERFKPLRDEFLKALMALPSSSSAYRNRFSAWMKNLPATAEEMVQPLSDLDDEIEKRIVWSSVGDGTWNGLNVTAPTMYFDPSQSVLASVSEERRGPSLAFQLPTKPFFAESNLHQQHVVVSVSPLVGFAENETSTFLTPFIPELNEFYGRQVHFIYNEVRVGPDNLGIICNVTRESLHLSSLPTQLLFSKIFETFGLKAEQSEPGRIARRVIDQLGGVQGCRVFKIPGVRGLIRDHGPLDHFTRSSAIQTIGNNDSTTGIPRFMDYEHLYIEARESGRLKPEDAFKFLLKHGVFRVGLNLICPVCELPSWVHLDAVKTDVECELCGATFNVTGQLRDRDWAYRRSGIFGREDHQLGSIPVALTLQQIHTILAPDMIYTTAIKLKSLADKSVDCEIDFAILSQKATWRSHLPQIAIGEAKDDGGEITEKDATNLARVADLLSKKRLDSYVIFSKTSSFRPEEIEACKKAQDPYRMRVIMLSGRELEPYFVYERTEKEFDIQGSAISLEDLAEATHHIYFEPKKKNPEQKQN